MRFLHTSDWHLGRTLHGQDLSEAHQAYLDHLVEVVRSEKVDAVLVSGDIYDRPIPPLDAVRQLDDALGRLSDSAHVVLTSGNHDSAARLGFGAGLLREGIHVRTVAADAGRPVEIPDAEGGTGLRVFCLPYLDPDLSRSALGEPGEDGVVVPTARSHEAVVGAAMRRVRTAVAAGARVPGVLMAHAFVAGGESSESEREITVGGVDRVPIDALVAEGVDYVALGHLHGPQRLEGPVPMRYSGSPLAFSFSEKDHVKSGVLVDVGADGSVHEELVGVPVARRLVEVRGTVEELAGRAHDAAREGWAKVVVTDPVRPEHLFARVRELFPHVLAVLHEPPVTTRVSGVDARAGGAASGEVLEQFVRQVTGGDASESEVAVLRSAWEEALAAERSA